MNGLSPGANGSGRPGSYFGVGPRYHTGMTATDTHAAQPRPDWTSGPAKWVAVMLLAGASITGMTWSMLRAAPRGPAPAAQAPSAAIGTGERPAPTPAPEPSATRINLNTASAAQLELLPGVGPAMAARIIEHRATHGPFRTIQDLDAVKGIGPRTIEKLRGLVTLE